MTPLVDRTSLEDRIIAATRAAASIVPDRSAPPLRLPGHQGQPHWRHQPRQPRRPRQPRVSFRPDWRGWPRESRLAAPLAATAAVIAVIAASVAIAGRTDRPAPSAGAGLAGVPQYYLELVPSSGTGLTTSASSSPPTTSASSSPPATTTSSSPPATTTSSSPPATSTSSSPPAPSTSTSTDPATVGSSTGRGDSDGLHAVIRDTLTGATVATIWPHGPFDTFVAATAAADDRTFVLAAQNISKSGVFPCGSTKLFQAQLNSADGKVTVRSLSVPVYAATSQVDAMAISPDGTRLAVAREAGQGCPMAGAVMVMPGDVPLKNTASEREQLNVYSLPGGAVKTWQSAPPWSINGQLGLNAMSWASDGMLAFNYPGKQGGPSGRGLWLLDTSRGGSLLGDSRLAVSAYVPPLRASRGSAAPPPGHWAWSGDGILAPDGTTVVAPMERTLRRVDVTGEEFGEFSASTGKQVRVLWAEQLPSRPFSVPYYSVLWTNSSGSVLIVAAPAASGKKGASQSVYGVLRGHRFTPIPGLRGAATLGLFTPTIMF
jgi:hypothetical protein